MNELSGKKWVSRFQGSNSTTTLSPTFESNVIAFLQSLKNAWAHVTISATQRPSERAYLMHWSWKLARALINPDNVPKKTGVNIEWCHRNGDGKIDRNKSIQAAKDMVIAYKMTNLNVAPALKSRHTEGNAIDMDITWVGSLELKNKKGETVIINSLQSSN
ncbi:peptidoglycan-binding domain-containing protein [Serratia sp. NA_13]|uniref:peptidoglycan-binding domain-containing protein n=1 Tax=Serratia sp. NA_13 TaxID=3415658 RepID=UPI004046DB28